MIVLGLFGQLGSGKSTAARLLVEQHGFVERSFATPLKRLVGQLFDLPDATLYGPSDARNVVDARGTSPEYWRGVRARIVDLAPELCALFARAPSKIARGRVLIHLLDVVEGLETHGASFSPRVALQQLGTEWGRALWQDVWTEACRREVETSGAARVVLSDVRFPNEAALVRQLGGRVVWIDASQRIAPTAGSHASESTLEQARSWVDAVVDNNGGVDALAGQLATLVEGSERK